MIVSREPKVVVHGHTHIGCEYSLGNTRVYCNPMGYPNENDSVYQPLIVEV